VKCDCPECRKVDWWEWLEGEPEGWGSLLWKGLLLLMGATALFVW
jgi:hypothetical protein